MTPLTPTIPTPNRKKEALDRLQPRVHQSQTPRLEAAGFCRAEEGRGAWIRGVAGKGAGLVGAGRPGGKDGGSSGLRCVGPVMRWRCNVMDSLASSSQCSGLAMSGSQCVGSQFVGLANRGNYFPYFVGYGGKPRNSGNIFVYLSRKTLSFAVGTGIREIISSILIKQVDSEGISEIFSLVLYLAAGRGAVPATE
jgi:hypothetical protein